MLFLPEVGTLMRLFTRLLEWLGSIQMVVVLQKQQIFNNIVTLNNMCNHNFALKSLPGGVLDQALLLAVGVAGHHPDGHGGPETMTFKHHYHPQQLLLSQLCPKITSWGSP